MICCMSNLGNKLPPKDSGHKMAISKCSNSSWITNRVSTDAEGYYYADIALVLASCSGRKYVAKLFLDYGADIDQKISKPELLYMLQALQDLSMHSITYML